MSEENYNTNEDVKDTEETVDTVADDAVNTDTAAADTETADMAADTVDDMVNADAVADDTDTTENAFDAAADEEEQTADTADAFECAENAVSEEEQKIIKASRKTTVVLVGIIIVLVAVIAVFAVLIWGKLSERSDEKKANDPANNITATGNSVDSGYTDDVSTNVVSEPRTYNVTTKLGKYKGVEVDYEVPEIDEADIDEELEYFCSDLSEERDVTDRPVAVGDIVNINYEGYMDGVQFDGGTADNQNLEIGSGDFIDGFEDALIGANIGDVVDVNIAFPDPYDNNPDFSGKPVYFKVTVNSITEFITPELTDELVAENTEFGSIAEYRADIRASLLEEAVAEADERLTQDVVMKVIVDSIFEGEIEDEINDLVEAFRANYDDLASAYYGVDGATLFGYFYGLSPEEYESMLHDDADYQVKYQHVLDAVAEAEQFTVTDEEFKDKFEYIFYEYYGLADETEVYENLTEEEVQEAVNGAVLREKAEKFVVDNAIVNK